MSPWNLTTCLPAAANRIAPARFLVLPGTYQWSRAKRRRDSLRSSDLSTSGPRPRATRCLTREPLRGKPMIRARRSMQITAAPRAWLPVFLAGLWIVRGWPEAARRPVLLFSFLCAAKQAPRGIPGRPGDRGGSSRGLWASWTPSPSWWPGRGRGRIASARSRRPRRCPGLRDAVAGRALLCPSWGPPLD